MIKERKTVTTTDWSALAQVPDFKVASRVVIKAWIEKNLPFLKKENPQVEKKEVDKPKS